MEQFSASFQFSIMYFYHIKLKVILSCEQIKALNGWMNEWFQVHVKAFISGWSLTFKDFVNFADFCICCLCRKLYESKRLIPSPPQHIQLSYGYSQRTRWTKIWGHRCRGIACHSLWDRYTEVCTHVLTSLPCLRCTRGLGTAFIMAIVVTGKARLGQVTIMSSLSIPSPKIIFLKQKTGSLTEEDNILQPNIELGICEWALHYVQQWHK